MPLVALVGFQVRSATKENSGEVSEAGWNTPVFLLRSSPGLRQHHGKTTQMRRRRGNQVDPMLMLLAMRLFQQIQQLPYKPPVTLALMGLMSWLFLMAPPGFDLCMTPAAIISDPSSAESLARFIVPALLHADSYHLYYNMSSFLWKGVQLEKRYGSEMFAILIAGFTLVSNLIFVALSALTGVSYHSCTVGFSGVLFALKMVLNADTEAENTVVYGISVPTRHAAWLELVLCSFFFPQTSFLGHLAGILAGVLFMCSSGAKLAALGRWWRSMVRGPQFWGSGTTSAADGGQGGGGGGYGGAGGSNVAEAFPNAWTGGSARVGSGGVSAEEMRQRRLQRLDRGNTFGTR